MDRTTINGWMERACSAGDAEAFGRLSDAVQDELFRLALSLGLSREDAAEATQETLMRAYVNRRTWQSGSDVVSWLCGICVNVCREMRRREIRKQSWLKRCASEISKADEAGFGGEDLEGLAAAIAELPERQREAIACRYLRRMSIRETAEAMRCAEGTVKSAVSAGLRALQGMLEGGHEKR